MLRRLPRWFVADQRPVALTTVVQTWGSAPRGPGARMVSRDGVLLDGTIGGGHLEHSALREAEALLASDEQSARREWALGPALAQCCGGRVAAVTEVIHSADATALAEAVRDGQGKTWRSAQGALVERLPAPTDVLIFGAGHVCRALSRVLTVQPWRVWVIDHRPEWADASAFPEEVDVRCASPVEALRSWGWLERGATTPNTTSTPTAGPAIARTLTLVMTHDHNLDQELVATLLRVNGPSGALPYLGLIGSKTKINSTKRRLEGLGFTEAEMARLVAPIGLKLDGETPVGTKRPGDIAISVAAELMIYAAERSL